MHGTDSAARFVKPDSAGVLAMMTRAPFALMLLSCALASTNTAAAERDETVLGGEIEHGGYGGPRIGYTRIAGNDAMWIGGEGGWNLDHHLIIGGAGFGLVTQQPAPGGVGSHARAGGPSRGLGLAADRIATISYGEERPLAMGHDEEAW